MIAASLDAAPTDQIDIASKNPSEIFLHLVQIEQRMAGLLVERDQHIHIALRAEIIAEYRAEQREFGYASSACRTRQLQLGAPGSPLSCAGFPPSDPRSRSYDVGERYHFQAFDATVVYDLDCSALVFTGLERE